MLCDGYERVVSSGAVFKPKLPERAESKTPSHFSRILLCSIEEEMELSIRSQNCLDNLISRQIYNDEKYIYIK